MKFDRDMPITWQGVVLILSLFAAFVSGGLLASTFSPYPGDDVVLVQTVTSVIFIASVAAAWFSYRSLKAMPDKNVDPAVLAHRRSEAEGRVAIYGPLILLVAIVMTIANAANARPGGTFIVPVGLLIMGVCATVYGLVRRRS